jgi:hypothetical protein
MRAAVLGVLSVIGAAALGCTPVRPAALDPSGLADPSLRPDEEAVTPRQPPPPQAAPAPPPAPEPPPPVVPRAPAPIAGCPLKWTPQDLHASVIIFPKTYVARFMEPIYAAMCQCTRPGDHLFLTGRIVTGTGEIALRTAAQPDFQTKEDPSVDACFAGVLRTPVFETFLVPSDSVCEKAPEPPPKQKMGPPFFRFPRRTGCSEGPGSTTIVYPFHVDRRGES